MPQVHYDTIGLRDAVQAQAVHTPEQLTAAGDDLRDQLLDRRFNQDEPPPYTSSTESEGEEEILRSVLGVGTSSILTRFAADLDRPLSEDDRYNIARRAQGVHNLYGAGRAYVRELALERNRDENFFSGCTKWQVKDWFRGERGQQRQSIIARHRIKQRWQRLGV